MVVLAPELPVITPSGDLSNFQDPVEGKLLIITLPVLLEQVGPVIKPIRGVDGVSGCALIIAVEEGEETHPPVFVTL